jgi:lysine 2,3-aminomutase
MALREEPNTGSTSCSSIPFHAGGPPEGSRQELARTVATYPYRSNDYYSRLAEGCSAISLMVNPSPAELSPANEALPEDPIQEDSFSPVPNLSHRYGDRVLMLVSDSCPVYCRFCTRKRKVGRTLAISDSSIEAGINYIEEHPQVRDVLLSGGDPLMLPPERLDQIVARICAIDHVEVIRVGTRVPAAKPGMITRKLVASLAVTKPVFVHTHFNHPAELTDESRAACRLLTGGGIPLANQAVLLRGVNDETNILEELFRSLLTMKVRPYYLFHVDTVRGTDHFRTPLMRGIDLMEELHQRTSPMALPRFVVDLPEGLGKVFPVRESVVVRDGVQHIRMPEGVLVPYLDPAAPGCQREARSEK